ncbi:MAG: PcfJ domain-containing protein [Solobacterium sp.]|nr:PcfJ domain-containing protein [Solobacterium sp.]
MFLEDLKEEREAVIRDFMAAEVPGMPAYVTYNEMKSEHLVIVFNEETDCFWALGMADYQKRAFEHAEKMNHPGVYWDRIRETYRSEQKQLVYRRNGARAYVYGLETFRHKHPYTASQIILWDSAGLERLLIKYDRDVIEVSFAILYMRDPQIEKLYKAGFEKLILDWVLRDRYTDGDLELFEACFSDEKTLNKITSLTKGQWQALLSFKIDLAEWLWMKETLNLHSVSDANVKTLTRLVIRGGDRFRDSFRHVLDCNKDGKPAYEADVLIHDLLNDHGHTGLKPQEACVYLWDYIRMCQRNQIEPDYRTEDLRREHDLAQTADRERRRKRSNPHLQEVYDRRHSELSRYLYESDELIVILPEKWSDLINEGRNNHNCVGTLYVDRYEDGTSNIFFIRRKEQIERSYITVELNASCEKTVQAFYSHNRRITDKRDLAFIKAWLKENRRRNAAVKRAVPAVL